MHRGRVCHDGEQGGRSKVGGNTLVRLLWQFRLLLFHLLNIFTSIVGDKFCLQLQWVRTEAGRRGTVVLLQPPGMSLHSINTSRTVWKGHR